MLYIVYSKDENHIGSEPWAIGQKFPDLTNVKEIRANEIELDLIVGLFKYNGQITIPYSAALKSTCWTGDLAHTIYEALLEFAKLKPNSNVSSDVRIFQNYRRQGK